MRGPTTTSFLRFMAAGTAAIQGWDTEFAALAEQVDAARRLALEVATDAEHNHVPATVG